MARRVDDVDLRLAVADGRVLGEDRDALLALEVHRVHHALGDVLVRAERAGLPQHRVDERRLAVVDVRHDGDVPDVVALGHRSRVAAAAAERPPADVFYILLTHAPRPAYHEQRRCSHDDSRPLRLLTVAGAVLALALPAAGRARRAPVDDRPGRRPVGRRRRRSCCARSTAASSRSPSRRRHACKLNGASRRDSRTSRPGFVATVAPRREGPAQCSIRAFGTPAMVTDRGIVTALDASCDHARTDAGGALTVPLDRRTRIPVPRSARRRGRWLAPERSSPSSTRDGSPAQVVNVLKRAGA